MRTSRCSVVARLFLALFAILNIAPLQAGGLIICPDWPSPIPPRIPPSRWHFPLSPLEISSEKVEAKIKDQVATVSIEQEFYNPNAQQLEGTFLFPIPKGAHLDKFKMDIGGKMMEPELLSADKARRIYEEIVRKAKDPALLEYEGRDLLKVRIFPIEPHSRKKIALSYTQVLKGDSGLYAFSLPLTPEKYSAKPIQKLSLDLELEADAPLKTIYSPTHTVQIDRANPKRAVVKLDTKLPVDERDFQMLYSVERSEVALRVLTHKPADSDGYFLLFASPGIDAADSDVVAKDVAFVLDTSGSMSGAKMEQARKALLFCVRNLNEQDRFEVLRFSTETEPLFRELRPASRENVKKAETFIEGLKAINGTAIDEALRQALELRTADSARPFVVIFLTDGLPTVGETREEKILANVVDRAKSTRVFCFGIGTDVNTHLLDKIAEQTRAFSQYVTQNEDIEVKVSSFFSKIRDPLLANLKIETSGDVRFVKQYPAALPDLFKGEQLIMAGRYTGNGKAGVTLSGSVNGKPKAFSEKIEFSEKDSDHEFIPRLWATRRVGALLDQIRLNGDSKELRDEVTELARQYGIVTPYTAFLIMEDESRRNIDARAQTLPLQLRAPEARNELRLNYDRYQKEKSGELAVRSSVANQVFLNVDNASQLKADNLSAAAGRASAPALEQQNSRVVLGRAFYNNNNAQWIDTRVQQQSGKQTPQRIKFNSEEYFAFASANKALAPILALGSNIQFVHNNQIVEIHD